MRNSVTEPRAVPGGHMSVDQKPAIGRRLLEVKASLPRGHSGPWLDKQAGLSRGMAHQCMALAREYEAHRAQQVTGLRQDARDASAV